MTETENFHLAATPQSPQILAASGRAHLPTLTRSTLNALCDAGGVSPAAWLRAMEFCGFRPDGTAWLAYWRQLCLLGGALFFVAGVVCFIAWNWGEMTPLARMALTGAVVAGSGIASVLLGPDTRLGRVLLLVCGLGIGPMLAVFGQTYQTGAELWELFRVWTILLVLLALAGRQTGLWFAAWLAANMFGALWLGRGLTSPLEALGQTIIVPEWLVVIACAVVCWEWAAYRATCRAAKKSAQRAGNETDRAANRAADQAADQATDQGAGHAADNALGHAADHVLGHAADRAWFCSRWMPRMLYFDLVSRTAFFLISMICGLSYGTDRYALWLPHNFVVGFAVGLAGLSWWWYRTRQPDLFMLASLLAAGAAVLLSGLADAELFFSAGIGVAILLWGLLVTGMTAGLAKILLHLQVSMATTPRREAEAVSFAPSIFGRTVAGASWQTLWAYLQKNGLVPQQQSLPEALATLGEQPSPLYVRAILAFGGWVAALLFICFTGILVDYDDGRGFVGMNILLASLPLLLLGWLMLPREHMFARHFGFALASAGTAGFAIALALSIKSEILVCFALALVFFVLCLIMRNAAYRFLAVVCMGNSVTAGILYLITERAGGFAAFATGGVTGIALGGTTELVALWWALVCLGLAFFCLREEKWRGPAHGQMADALFYGLYTAMLLFQIATIGVNFGLAGGVGVPAIATGHMGMGAAVGVAVLAFCQIRGACPGTGQMGIRPAPWALLAGLPLVFALSWYLPGVGLALLGLALARQMGSVVMQGFVLAYLFAYMGFYYYSLAVPFSLKSLYLVATGLGLLAVALVLRLWQAKQTAGEAGHA